MTKYVMRAGQWVNPSTGEPMLTDDQRSAPLPLPYVLSDIPAYESPIDGRMITSRSERREDFKRNNCIDARDFPSATGGRIKSEKLAKRYGLQVSEEYR
jgi:hypothetical protein